ncbi:hypothetical protein [Pseudothioclava arenosa]|uniref:hypothetical protein n=1 Tax=Pseudothioclava arenosa TaxID=1795308 RepID=UPI0015C70ABC|nr:hypothetical protein [Pseudothioclava arenosa]
MRRPIPSHPPRRSAHPSDPPLSLGDIVEALCGALPANGAGVEFFLDRLERQK